jgi:citrate synthase
VSRHGSGRQRIRRTRQVHQNKAGNRYLKGSLGIAALSAARSNGTYFSAKYRRIAFRRVPIKALAAGEHAMLTAAWHMLTTGELYREPRAAYVTRADTGQNQGPRDRTARIPGLPGHPRTAATGG